MGRELFFLLLCPAVMCNVAFPNPRDLVSEYVSKHNPLDLPLPHSTSSLEVSVNFNLLHIEDLDESKQLLTTTGWFFFAWSVEGLSWNESEYQNISRIMVSPKDIWLPDLVLSNSNVNLGGESQISTISSNGTMEWHDIDRRSTSCAVDVTNFPFDKQRCFFELTQWVTFTSEIDYIFNSVPISFTSLTENGEWEVLDSFVNEYYPGQGLYQVLELGFILGRRRTYFILTAVLPVCILSCLNLMVFHVPPESGEKMTLCVSVLLAYAVCLTSINSFLPSVSDHVALFSIYLHYMFVLKALTVVASVFVLHLHTAQPKSTIRKRLTKLLSAYPKKATTCTLSTGNTDDNDLTDASMKPNTNTEDAKQVLEQEQWFHIVKKVDLLFFCVFLIVFIVSTCGFFCTTAFRQV
ncbi:neuronal acetylcholine receptor subunit alpha-5-like [Haliotis asinina]|uniref:neuronal acetylcholine receptor subunit alpha-5-like n=1 Tax=Haliotis asinina TaxID=109174 RepID=UPI0035321D00